jgi:hypothetical protein
MRFLFFKGEGGRGKEEGGIGIVVEFAKFGGFLAVIIQHHTECHSWREDRLGRGEWLVASGEKGSFLEGREVFY